MLLAGAIREPTRRKSKPRPADEGTVDINPLPGEDRMVINEVFLNPTVKTVAFEIRFPNLFYLENRVGDFQIEVMPKFPESKLLIRANIILADFGPEVKAENLPKDRDSLAQKKIWSFRSESGIELNLLTDSLNLQSTVHKTYNSASAAERFRDTIDFVLSRFFKVFNVPIVTRIGLRYIDECPVPPLGDFEKWYSTTLPCRRFPLSDTIESKVVTRVKRDNYFFTYNELFRVTKDGTTLTLDFDSYAERVESGKCLEVTDRLHEIISEEYEKTLKEAVFEYMRKPKESKK
jgi:uncharacterized protein (TIGR04255 family)